MLKMRDLRNSFSAIDKALEERNVEDCDIFNIIILSDEIDFIISIRRLVMSAV